MMVNGKPSNVARNHMINFPISAFVSEYKVVTLDAMNSVFFMEKLNHIMLHRIVAKRRYTRVQSLVLII